MKKIYEVTLHRIVEHETIFRLSAESEEEAEEMALVFDYDEVVHDSEEGEVEEPQVIDITKVL